MLWDSRGHRRDADRPPFGLARPPATGDGSPRPPDPDGRQREQVVLGRPAGRLDQGRAGSGDQAVRVPPCP
jgi:hypothetical protein